MRRPISILFCMCVALAIDIASGWVTQKWSGLLVPASTPNYRTRRRNRKTTMVVPVTHHQQEDITAPPALSIKSTPTVVDVDNVYYSELPSESEGITASSSSARITLTRYLDQAVKKDASLQNVQSLLLGLQMACKTISNLVNRAGLVYNNFSSKSSDPQVQDGRIQSMKRLDQLATLVLRNALQYTRKFEIVTPAVEAPARKSPAEHQPGVVLAQSLQRFRWPGTRYTPLRDILNAHGKKDSKFAVPY